MAPQAAPSAEGVPDVSVEAAAAAARAIGDLVGACGPALDACGATPGCPAILACAASTGCSGNACYCLEGDCDQAGPCRDVILSAPGASEAPGSDRGPAARAASAVGQCLDVVDPLVDGEVEPAQSDGPDASPSPDAASFVD